MDDKISPQPPSFPLFFPPFYFLSVSGLIFLILANTARLTAPDFFVSLFPLTAGFSKSVWDLDGFYCLGGCIYVCVGKERRGGRGS